MTHLFKGIAFSAVLVLASGASRAETSDVHALKSDIDNAVKKCESDAGALTCAWSDDILDKTLKTCKADPKDFECEALDVKDHLPYPKSAVNEEVDECGADARELADPLYAALKDFEGPKKKFKTFPILNDYVDKQLLILKASCKADVAELNHKLSPVFEIYKAFGGKSCRGK